MSARSLSVLAFASAALAVPHAQWQPFKHGHHHHYGGPPGYGSESSPVAPISGAGIGTAIPAPYPAGNSTNIWGSTGTGTGYGTGTAPPPSVYPTAPVATGMPSPIGPATVSSYVAVETETECSSDVTFTMTETETVYYTAGQSSAAVSAASAPLTSTKYLTTTITPPSGTAPVGTAPVSAGFSSYPVPSGYSAPSAGSSPVSAGFSSYPAPPSYSAPSVSSSPVAPVSSSAPAPYSAPSSSSSSSSSSPVAPVSTSSSSSTPVYIAPTSSSVYVAPTSSSSAYVAPTTSTSVYVAPTTSSTSSSSAAATPTGYTSNLRGKRGLAYNDASLTECMASSPMVGYAYNWGSDCSGFSASGIQYIPTLWSAGSDFTDSWEANANAAIKSGSTYLFSFNEPDNTGQANMSPTDAATAWMTYMEPFAGKAKLVAPSVTNGGGSMGLDWLDAFLTACSGCTIDAVNQHWYDTTSNDASYFKEQISNATTVSGGKPVFVSEFGAIGTDAEISSFLQDVMPWMDNNDDVIGYSYFMVSDGLLISGTEPSSYGETFINYS